MEWAPRGDVGSAKSKSKSNYETRMIRSACSVAGSWQGKLWQDQVFVKK